MPPSAKEATEKVLASSGTKQPTIVEQAPTPSAVSPKKVTTFYTEKRTPQAQMTKLQKAAQMISTEAKKTNFLNYVNN